jgi:hypothetical protein
VNTPRVVHGPGFKIRYEDESGYLRAHVFDGEDSQAVSIAMWRMLGAECKATGATCMLVLEELTGSVAQDEIEPTIEAMVQTGLRDVRIAFVELLDDVEGSEYGAILGLEHGLTARVFSTEGDARRWLLYDY